MGRTLRVPLNEPNDSLVLSLCLMLKKTGRHIPPTMLERKRRAEAHPWWRYIDSRAARPSGPSKRKVNVPSGLKKRIANSSGRASRNRPKSLTDLPRTAKIPLFSNPR